MIRRSSVAGGPHKTKKPRFVKGLASFDAAVDCASANNRLKPRAAPSARTNSGLPRNSLSTSESGPFSRREAKRDSREENALSPRGDRAGNWESDERDIRNKIRKRLGRNRPRRDSCSVDRAGDPHLPVPALQHPLGIDEGNASGRRLPVRLEIFLRLQPLFDPAVAAAVFGTRLRFRAGARRYRRVPPAEG